MTNGPHPSGRAARYARSTPGTARGTPEAARSLLETDGGRSGDGEHAGESDRPRGAERADGRAAAKDTELATYTDEEHGYRLEYPANWSVEADAGGATTFRDVASRTGAVVVVESVNGDLATYVEAFRATLAADDHVHDLEQLDRRTVMLPGGHRGRVVECAYVGDEPDERWRLTYLFVVTGTTGYTVGVDWAADADCEAVARTVVESFALAAKGTA